ncbi:hypothetical protein OR571_19435 [Psychrobacillus sp. NEAU-3TGS]|uniref:hypothetical protein n=1 Tax=Psychrobacillus sp. NEAU-3TGS TaxID=2995412 RepID=UPI0024963DE8|nr:hypothetical protein [Psychrobacillus sp. NEAU-3TGS]MDI2589212.1 hypothetical protein [Psychrobacillus sp. NEAU-3TGS]
MKKKCVIIGTDLRLSYFHTAISKDLNTKLVATMTWDDELKNAIDQFEPQIVFLPIHPLKMECPLYYQPHVKSYLLAKK